ncbi:MAG: alpha/beta hydrolase [Leptospiraceae bacterium]|nr:alpha/beta hydrolase [Leptospiraceae bacterium]
MSSPKKTIITITSILVLLIFIVVPWFFSTLVLYPAIICDKQHHVYCGDPSELGLKFDTVKFSTSDAVELEGWYIEGETKGKAILFVHGHGGSRNEAMRFLPSLHKEGYSLLTINLRRNAGKFASMGFYEKLDVLAAIDYLIKEKKMDSVGIFGFSMGAATSIIAMEEDKRVKVGLFSSGYANAFDVLIEAASRDYHVPYYPLIPIVRTFLNFRGNMKIESVIPEDKIGNISPRPITIFHCDADDYVSVTHANRLFEKAKEPKQIWIPKCTRHERIWNTNREESERRAIEFFNQNL